MTPATSDSIVTIDGPVAKIELAQPERGSPINLQTVALLGDALERARAADCRVIVLSSTGGAFSVGGDIREFGAATQPGAYIEELAGALHRLLLGLHEMDAIVISVVTGVAAGAGFPLAAAADLVLAAESATFTLAYTRIGLTPDGGSSLLTSSLGLHRTLALALLNPVLSAREALQAGLITAVYPDQEMAAGVQTVIDTLLAGSRSAQVGSKRLIRRRAMAGAAADLDAEMISIAGAADSADGIEGVRAFLEKRPARFTT